jgi:hypothetical protein
LIFSTNRPSVRPWTASPIRAGPRPRRQVAIRQAQAVRRDCAAERWRKWLQSAAVAGQAPPTGDAIWGERDTTALQHLLVVALGLVAGGLVFWLGLYLGSR